MTDAPTIRVLIVEDQMMFADALQRVLAEEPDIQPVARVGSVRDAVSGALHFLPDVVVMDYALGDGDGVSAAREIKRQLPATQVVMLTGNADPAVLIAAVEAGCSGFITKSQAANELVHGVRRAFHGEAVIEPTLLATLLPRLHRSSPWGRSPLTRREMEVLRLLALGKSNKDIAKEMVLSVNTVRCHVQNLMTKLEAHSKLEAVSKAARQGIIAAN